MRGRRLESRKVLSASLVAAAVMLVALVWLLLSRHMVLAAVPGVLTVWFLVDAWRARAWVSNAWAAEQAAASGAEEGMDGRAP